MARSGVRLKRGMRMNHVKRALQELPVRVAEQVAREGAGDLTDAAGASYDAGQTVYETPRPLGVQGNQLSLNRTGATRGFVRFVQVGTVLRCVLGTKYARYLIGKYGILPGGKSAIPDAWRQRLKAITDRAVGGGL